MPDHIVDMINSADMCSGIWQILFDAMHYRPMPLGNALATHSCRTAALNLEHINIWPIDPSNVLVTNSSGTAALNLAHDSTRPMSVGNA